MAQEGSLTPEKQLLKIIEESKAKGGEAAVETQAAKHRNMSFFSPAAWLGRAAYFKDQFFKSFKGQGALQLDIKLVNKGLGGLIFILALYLIGNSYFSMVNLKKVVASFQIGGKNGGKPQIADVNSVLKKEPDYYIEKVNERDIFTMLSKKKTGPEAVKEVTQEEIAALSETLKLVGISWSNNPDAIIEDTKAARTFFLKKGQTISGAKIKEIFQDRVIMLYGDQEFELK